MITQIFSILFPIFAIILVGYFYAHRYPTDMSVPNRLNVSVFIPALIFGILSDHSFQLADYQTLAFSGAMIILGPGILLLPVIYFSKIQFKTFIPPMMFTNTGNMGIPVALFAFGEQILPAAIVLFIVGSTLHFTVGLTLLSRQKNWAGFLKLPIMQATILGLIVSLLHIKIPEFLLVPIEMLGRISVPLMIFALGVRLTDIDLTYWKIGLLGAILCPISGIIIFLIIAPWINLPTSHFALLLVYSALPPAMLNFIIAEQYQQQPLQVASIVLLGNVMSIVSLPIVLSFALRWSSI